MPWSAQPNTAMDTMLASACYAFPVSEALQVILMISCSQISLCLVCWMQAAAMMKRLKASCVQAAELEVQHTSAGMQQAAALP